MKKVVRKQLLEERKALSIETINEWSKTITKRCLEQIELENAQTIAIYYPINHEVDVLPLINALLEMKKRVVLPRVTGKTTMEFYQIHEIDAVERSKFGVYEPNTGIQVEKDKIDLMFIPGVGFNRSCYRLGYGAGYYDRYLAAHSFKTIGVCFDFQITDAFETNDYDIPLNQVISENRLLQRQNGDCLPNQYRDN
jgi:5-formyltetrahydrofolate cyclo-ligase